MLSGLVASSAFFFSSSGPTPLDRAYLWHAGDTPPPSLSDERMATAQCVRAADLHFPPHPMMCNYGPKEWVSRSYYWKPPRTYEAQYVAHFMQAMAMASSRRGDIGFLDCGSNFGTFGVHVAARGHPSMLVDANRDNLLLAHMSAKRNHVKHMTFLNAAVGGKSGEWLIFNYTQRSTSMIAKKRLNVGGFSFGGKNLVSGHSAGRAPSSANAPKTAPGAIAVPMLSLSGIGEQIPFAFPTRKLAMKMDIQGWETLALEAGDAFFERFDVRLLMLEYPHTQEIDTVMRRRGFLPYTFPINMPQFLPAANYTQLKVAWWYKQ